ncbi:hypothetical protein [Nonomuraea sp. NPDC003709]|uniref:hypothetical protein n=1 Tax=Nonomuraea sp. NPDC003709 TaxID=3154450 RepID=UPI00339EEA47
MVDFQLMRLRVKVRPGDRAEFNAPRQQVSQPWGRRMSTVVAAFSAKPANDGTRIPLIGAGEMATAVTA